MVCDFGLCGIMVNVVQFGFIEIDIVSDENVWVMLCFMMVIGCMGCGDEVVSLVVFLVCVEVSFIIGVVLMVDGGYFV